MQNDFIREVNELKLVLIENGVGGVAFPLCDQLVRPDPGPVVRFLKKQEEDEK